MNDYFVSVTDLLCLKENSEVAISAESVSDPIERGLQPDIQNIQA